MRMVGLFHVFNHGYVWLSETRILSLAPTKYCTYQFQIDSPTLSYAKTLYAVRPFAMNHVEWYFADRILH